MAVPRPALDEGAARQLWDVSEKLTGVQWLTDGRSRAALLMRGYENRTPDIYDTVAMRVELSVSFYSGEIGQERFG